MDNGIEKTIDRGKNYMAILCYRDTKFVKDYCKLLRQATEIMEGRFSEANCQHCSE